MRLLTLFAIVSAVWAQPSFDVATVKEVHEFQSGTASEKIIAHPGNLTMRSVRLRACIMWAYNVKDYQISGPGWLGAPGWGGSDIARFEIIAKAPQDAAIPQMKLMLQRLLAGRFKLVLHRETKEVPVLVLATVKSSPELKLSVDQEGEMRVMPGATGITFLNATLTDLAETLSGPLREPVVDRTGLKGRFDFSLKTARSSSPDEQLSDLAYSLRTQLGLELKRQRDQLEFLMVDSAERKPVEN